MITEGSLPYETFQRLGDQYVRHYVESDSVSFFSAHKGEYREMVKWKDWRRCDWNSRICRFDLLEFDLLYVPVSCVSLLWLIHFVCGHILF